MMTDQCPTDSASCHSQRSKREELFYGSETTANDRQHIKEPHKTNKQTNRAMPRRMRKIGKTIGFLVVGRAVLQCMGTGRLPEVRCQDIKVVRGRSHHKVDCNTDCRLVASTSVLLPFLSGLLLVSPMRLTQEMVFIFVLLEPLKIWTANSISMEKLGHEDKILLRTLLSRYQSFHNFRLHAGKNGIQIVSKWVIVGIHKTYWSLINKQGCQKYKQMAYVIWSITILTK